MKFKLYRFRLSGYVRSSDQFNEHMPDCNYRSVHTALHSFYNFPMLI